MFNIQFFLFCCIMANDFFRRASSKRVMIGGLALVGIVTVLIWSFACAWHDWHAGTLTASQSETRGETANISLTTATAAATSPHVQHSPSLVSGVFVFEDDDDKHSNANTFVLTRTTASALPSESKTFLDYLFGCTERTNALCASNAYVFSLRENPQTIPLVCRIEFSPHEKGAQHVLQETQQQQLSKTKTHKDNSISPFAAATFAAATFATATSAASAATFPNSVSASIDCQKGRLLDNAPQLAIHQHHQRYNNKMKRWWNDNITKHHPATDTFEQAVQELVAPIPADAKLFQAKFVAQPYKWHFQLCRNHRPRWVVKNKETKETTVYLPVVEVETRRLFFIPQNKAYFLPSLFRVDKIKFQPLDSIVIAKEKRINKTQPPILSRTAAYAGYAKALAESGRIDALREKEGIQQLSSTATYRPSRSSDHNLVVVDDGEDNNDDDDDDDKKEGHVLRGLNKTREFRKHYASIQHKRMLGVLESHKQKWSDAERRKMHQILSEERQDTPFREKEETFANQDEIAEKEMEESTQALVLGKYRKPATPNSATKLSSTISQPREHQTLRKSISQEYQSRYSAAERAKAEQEDGNKETDREDDLLMHKLYDNNQKRNRH